MFHNVDNDLRGKFDEFSIANVYQQCHRSRPVGNIAFSPKFVELQQNCCKKSGEAMLIAHKKKIIKGNGSYRLDANSHISSLS